MRIRIILAALLAASASGIIPETRADPRAGIVIPADGDLYSKLVARAEADDRTVDFRALRFAWLDSAARLRAHRTTINELSRDMMQAAKDRSTSAVRNTAEKILSIDYTYMAAHKFRRQSCHVLGDTLCEDHEEFVEFGLLKSITRGKDGKSPATAWEVASIHEEYFIMSMAGLKVQNQQLEGTFDKFVVTDETGATREVFFNIYVMLTKEFPGVK